MEEIPIYYTELRVRRSSRKRIPVGVRGRKRVDRDDGKTRGKVKRFLNEFLLTSTIHGLSHLAARKHQHVTEYALWIVTLAAAITGMSYMGLNAWRRYQHYPTVISMEKDYKNWNTSYATATMCPEFGTDEERLRELAVRYKVKDEKRFVQFFTALSRSSYGEFRDIPDYDEVGPDEYLMILAEARFNFTFAMSNTQNIKQEPLLTVTENGLCYSVNSDLGLYFTAGNFGEGPVTRRKVDLVVGNPLDGEVFVQIMNINSQYNVTITGPYDLPDVAFRKTEARTKHFLSMELTVLPIISSDQLRSLAPQQRKCRFSDESNLEISSIYSYHLCRMQCRADTAYDLCKCIPHFYRKSRRRPYCDAAGLRCLGKHARLLSDLRDPVTGEKIHCGCLPLCNDLHYLISQEILIPWPVFTHFKYYMTDFPRTRLRRDVIFGFTEFLVSIGGSAGLLLGCSVLSFIEIFYFFTVRLFLFFWTTPGGSAFEVGGSVRIQGESGTVRVPPDE